MQATSRGEKLQDHIRKKVGRAWAAEKAERKGVLLLRGTQKQRVRLRERGGERGERERERFMIVNA